MRKLLSGRFSKSKRTSKLVEEFTASPPFDQCLYPYDIEGSIAHAKMLGKCKIIPPAEAKAIVKGLKEIKEEIEKGKFKFDIAWEDIHMNIEKRLIEKIGNIGGKLHTARSRNDQVALDLRLYLKAEIGKIDNLIKRLEQSLLKVAEENLEAIMPGYTHLQQAQPVLFSHHLLAYVQMLERNRARFSDCLKRVDVLPLGAVALAGTSFPIDRKYVAKLLNFSKVAENSLDAVSDRDFVIEFISASSLLMLHLSRLSEELVLWSTEEFNFIELDDAFCTGSSVMPQKKNPDVAELVRGKAGRVYGNLMALLTLMKGLPLTYNRDMQEDKEPLFDTIDTVKSSLVIYAEMIRTMKVKKENMEKALERGYSNATDLADYLVKKGVPFRTAHGIVWKIVKYCLRKGKPLSSLSLAELRTFSTLFEEDAHQTLDFRACVEGRASFGGTATKNVRAEIRRLKENLLS